MTTTPETYKQTYNPRPHHNQKETTMFGSKEREEKRRRGEKAANLERLARDQDRLARQHGAWSRQFSEEGLPDHSRIWAEHLDQNAREADRLRKQAAKLRSGKGK